MSAALPYLPDGFDAAAPAASRLKRFGPLLPIIALHGLLFYALQSGTSHRVTPALPPAFFATLIPSEPTQAQKAPELPLKTVPVTKPTLPVVPALDPVAVVPAITVAAPVAAAPNAPSSPAPAAISAPAAPAVPTSVPKTVSGVEYIQPPQPEYPSLSRRMGEQGKVTLRVLVNDKGRAERIELQHSSGIARLDEAARNAVARAVFKPYIEDGKAIAVYVIVPIGFQLD
jgi:protein TonB